MRHMLFRIIALVVVCIGASGVAADRAGAQLPEEVAPGQEVWEIRLTDGSTIYGRVEAVTPASLTVISSAGVRMEIERAQIRSMAPAAGAMRDGVRWPDDPNLTRLFFGPTGRMLAAGEGYVGAFELFLPFLSFGITDYLTIGGGTPVVPGAVGRVFYLTPKIGLRAGDRTDLAAGLIAFHDTGSYDPLDDFATAGVLYLVGTHGDADRALTLGVGWGFAGEEVNNRPAALVGFESRLSPRLKFVSENYLISYRTSRGTDFGQLFSGGVRIFGDRLSADAGLGFMYDSGDLQCCLPLVNFVYNFGAGR